jgi:hypothetical protein
MHRRDLGPRARSSSYGTIEYYVTEGLSVDAAERKILHDRFVLT